MAVTGEESGTIVEHSGGEDGRCGGGVTDRALGVPGPEGGEEPAVDDESCGEKCPL